MGSISAIKTCLRKYASFSGRASRNEFWWFAIASLGLAIIIEWLDVALLGDALLIIGPFSFAPLLHPYLLALLLPLSAVFVRRLHDTGLSGIVIPFSLPVIWALSALDTPPMDPSHDRMDFRSWLGLATSALVIVSFIHCLRASNPGPNSYGSNPLQSPAEVFE